MKVGIASNVPGRVAELQVGNPVELRLLGFWRAVNAIREEEIIHAFLDSYRVRGECFKLPKSMMDMVAMKVPELAQRIMPNGEFSKIRDALWRLNSSAYHSESQRH